MKQMPVYCITLPSPAGQLVLRADDKFLRRIDFGAQEALTGWVDGQGREGPLREAVRQLTAYFQGRRRHFELPLAPLVDRGTSFQQSVWAALAEIPFGQTCSYADIAARIGRPRAVRAVGNANARNPLPIVVPCHRVIASDGSLGGFAGGLAAKRALLALESDRQAISG